MTFAAATREPAQSLYQPDEVTSIWQQLLADRSGLAGLIVIALFALVCLAVWLGLAGQDWAQAKGGRWEAASQTYWWGTNVLGQDIFQRSVYSVTVAFEIGVLVALSSGVIGAIAGATAGWHKNSWLEQTIVLLMGIMDSIPFYLFVAALAFALQGYAPFKQLAMQLAMIACFWTTTARLVRAEVMRLREQEFVQSAVLLGLPAWRVLLRHVLPNTSHILLAQSAIVFAAAIKAEVVLSFLGLGVQDGVSWGLMLAESTQEVLAGQFNNFWAASLPLFALLLGFNLLADALQSAMDPRQLPA
ncbi:MAG: ABC transporter permease [Xanthomonadales bacterium]|nr:ABC transporter permease [Xanthomonadales bacterium]